MDSDDYCDMMLPDEDCDLISQDESLRRENEQLRKERDEYKHKYELTRAGVKTLT